MNCVNNFLYSSFFYIIIYLKSVAWSNFNYWWKSLLQTLVYSSLGVNILHQGRCKQFWCKIWTPGLVQHQPWCKNFAPRLVQHQPRCKYSSPRLVQHQPWCKNFAPKLFAPVLHHVLANKIKTEQSRGKLSSLFQSYHVDQYNNLSS